MTQHNGSGRSMTARMGEQGSELKMARPGSVKFTARVAARLGDTPDESIRKTSYAQKPYWDIERARIGRRPVYFDDRLVDTPIYERSKLQPGDCLGGPGIVEEFGSTTVIFPRMHARVDEYANLLLAAT